MPDSSTQVSFVTVSSFWNPLFAWTLRNKLVDEGIDAFVHDEFVVTTYWFYANAIGGVKVQVPYGQLLQAEEIIDRDDSQVFSSMKQTATNPDAAKCRSCGSSEVHKELINVRLFFLVWMLLGVPYPFFSSAIECYDCGHRDGPPSIFKFQYSIWHLLILTFIVACTLGIMKASGYSWFQHAATPNVDLPTSNAR